MDPAALLSPAEASSDDLGSLQVDVDLGALPSDQGFLPEEERVGVEEDSIQGAHAADFVLPEPDGPAPVGEKPW